MEHSNLLDLETWDSEEGTLNVIIETPKGCRNKFDYEPQTGSFALKKVLPSGMSFPYDFGFVPSTRAEDGDPLDVLVLMDEPAFPGCRIACRLIGVIEGEEAEDGKTERNDRLVAVAKNGHDHSNIHSLKDVNDHLLDEIEHFFVAYHDLDGKKYTLLGKHGSNRAEKLVREGMKQFRRGHRPAAKATPNGKHKHR